MIDISKGAKKLLHLRSSRLVIDIGNEELVGVVHWGYWDVGGHGHFDFGFGGGRMVEVWRKWREEVSAF